MDIYLSFFLTQKQAKLVPFSKVHTIEAFITKIKVLKELRYLGNNVSIY